MLNSVLKAAIQDCPKFHLMGTLDHPMFCLARTLVWCEVGFANSRLSTVCFSHWSPVPMDSWHDYSSALRCCCFVINVNTEQLWKNMNTFWKKKCAFLTCCFSNKCWKSFTYGFGSSEIVDYVILEIDEWNIWCWSKAPIALYHGR